MSRVLLLAALLAGCSTPPAPRVFATGQSVEGYAEAVEAGDTEAALDLLRDAAHAGDLEALAALARAYDCGYLSGGWVEGGSAHLPIRTLPWTASLVQRRFDRELRQRAEAGDPEALFMTADALVNWTFVDGAWETSRADRDSARAIYRHLEQSVRDDQRLRLAFLAQRLGDDDAYHAHLATAAEAGDPQACLSRSWATPWDTPPGAAERIAAEIDEYETCRARARGTSFAGSAALFAHSDRVVSSLREQARTGNPAATATLDSLRALGVFDRHPRLVDLGS